MRREAHPSIGFVDGPAGRRPIVIGTGLDVWEVVETVRANDDSPEAAAEYLDVPVARIRAALRYHAEFADEIDAWIDRNRAIAEREERSTSGEPLGRV
jgi:uncharacterized protein (DUF433 family)